jgi:mannose/fructose/N-acetylgalactosamine-specific phosphotransferase system component IIC
MQEVTIGAGAAFLIAFGYYFGNSPFAANLGFSAVIRPLIAGTLVGFILGKPVEGAMIGGTINLIYLGFISAGGATPADIGLAGWLGTALALAGNLEPAAALALAAPLGAIGVVKRNATMSINALFVHAADRYAEEPNPSKVALMNWLPAQLINFALSFTPVYLGALLGGKVVGQVVQSVPPWVIGWLTVAGGMLAALGIALNLRFLLRLETLPYFLLGFIVAVTAKLNLVLIAVAATALALLHVTFTERRAS